MMGLKNYRVFIIVVAAIVVGELLPKHKKTFSKKHAYLLFDSTLAIETPFQLSADTLRTKQDLILDTSLECSYLSHDIEFTIQCIKFKYSVPNKGKKTFLNTWINTLDSEYESISTIEKERLINLRNQKYEYYEGIIKYLKGHPVTHVKQKYFTTLITSKGKYVYFIDINYNRSDLKTIDTRDEIFDSIDIR